MRVIGKGIKLPISAAQDGERFQRGRIYIAPPGYHLLIERSILPLESGPKKIFTRPSVDE